MSGRSLNVVRQHRISRCWTQRELAKKSGLSLRTIHSVERNRACRMTTKRKIILAFGLDFRIYLGEVFPQHAEEFYQR